MAIPILVIALRLLHIPRVGIECIKAARVLVVITGPEILHLQRIVVLLTGIQIIRPRPIRNPLVAAKEHPVGVEAVSLHHRAAGMRQQPGRTMPVGEQGFAAVAAVLAEDVIADDVAAAKGAGAVEFFQDLRVAGEVGFVDEEFAGFAKGSLALDIAIGHRTDTGATQVVRILAGGGNGLTLLDAVDFRRNHAAFEVVSVGRGFAAAVLADQIAASVVAVSRLAFGGRGFAEELVGLVVGVSDALSSGGGLFHAVAAEVVLIAGLEDRAGVVGGGGLLGEAVELVVGVADAGLAEDAAAFEAFLADAAAASVGAERVGVAGEQLAGLFVAEAGEAAHEVVAVAGGDAVALVDAAALAGGFVVEVLAGLGLGEDQAALLVDGDLGQAAFRIVVVADVGVEGPSADLTAKGVVAVVDRAFGAGQGGETAVEIVTEAADAARFFEAGESAQGVVVPLHLAGDAARIKGGLIGEDQALGGASEGVVHHLGDAALEVLPRLEVAEAVVGLGFRAIAGEAAAELAAEMVVAEAGLAALGVGDRDQVANRGDKFRGLRNESR